MGPPFRQGRPTFCQRAVGKVGPTPMARELSQLKRPENRRVFFCLVSTETARGEGLHFSTNGPFFFSAVEHSRPPSSPRGRRAGGLRGKVTKQKEKREKTGGTGGTDARTPCFRRICQGGARNRRPRWGQATLRPHRFPPN